MNTPEAKTNKHKPLEAQDSHVNQFYLRFFIISISTTLLFCCCFLQFVWWLFILLSLILFFVYFCFLFTFLYFLHLLFHFCGETFLISKNCALWARFFPLTKLFITKNRRIFFGIRMFQRVPKTHTKCVLLLSLFLSNLIWIKTKIINSNSCGNRRTLSWHN